MSLCICIGVKIGRVGTYEGHRLTITREMNAVQKQDKKDDAMEEVTKSVITADHYPAKRNENQCELFEQN